MHQLRQSIHTAPNKLAGLAAFAAFYSNVARRKLFRSNGRPPAEGKLSDHFAANVVKE